MINQNQQMSMEDVQTALSTELSSIGGALNGMPKADGQIHRLPELGKKKSDDAVWYVAKELDNGLVFANYGNWRSGEQREWNSRGDALQLSKVDRAAINNFRRETEGKQQAEKLAAAQEAARRWDAAEQANQDHPYLAKKMVLPHGLRQSGDELIVPVSIDGKVTSIQRINSFGEKRFLKGGQTRSGYFQIGEIGSAIYLVEGYATGATIYEATGEGVIVAFNAGNLLSVCQAMRERYKLPIIIAGDDDRFTTGNPGRTKAEAAAAQVENVTCLFPVFASDDGQPTDFNDLHCREGVDAVREVLLSEADQFFDAFTFDECFDPSNIPERLWIVCGLLLRGYVTAGIAPPGVGKSTFAAMIAVMVTTGWEKPDA